MKDERSRDRCFVFDEISGFFLRRSKFGKGSGRPLSRSRTCEDLRPDRNPLVRLRPGEVLGTNSVMKSTTRSPAGGVVTAVA